MSRDNQDELLRFAEILMSVVRDRSISACDQLASGSMRGPDGERWKSLLNNETPNQLLTELIPDIVDQTIFQFLNAIDNEELPIGWRQKDGAELDFDEFGRGELAGWFMGSPGWRHDYSSKRFFDPLAGLRLDLDLPDPEPLPDE